MKPYWSLLLVLALAACAAPPAPSPTPSVTPSPSATRTPSLTPSRTPSPTPTFTPSPTLHPLTIESMRNRAYPGSDLVIEQSLEPGSNYTRYIAAYLSDGLKIYGLLTIPNGEPPASGWPAILFNHGYIPPDVYRTTERYVAYVDAFARNGYVVFKPDYRGHGDSQGQPGGAYSRPDYTIDVLNAFASVQRLPEVDPQRMGMWGHSMGGHITLRAMVIEPDIRAGVIWAGVVASYPDIITRWRPTPVAATASPFARRWAADIASTYGLPEENPGFWASISPIDYVGEVSGPLQLHHGTADADVPVLFSQLLYEQAQAAEVEVEFYTYPDDNHNISNYFSLAMQRSVEFFDRHVKGAPAP